MLRTILAISGRPGLFRLLSQGRNALIVEDLATKRRLPVTSRDRVSSLGDISIYTVDGDTPLADVLQKVYDERKGEPVDVAAAEADLHEAFAQFLPEHDRERVHNGDIRKLFQWYNLLLAAGFTAFKEEEKEAEEGEKEAETEK